MFTLGNVCAVLWIFSIVGDIIITARDILSTLDCVLCCGGYHQTLRMRVFCTIREYYNYYYCGGYPVLWGLSSVLKQEILIYFGIPHSNDCTDKP